MYNIQSNIMYTLDEEGNHSVELAYVDSDGSHVEAYAEDADINNVIEKILDQIEGSLAEQDDARADTEELKILNEKIDALNAELSNLNTQKMELENRKKKNNAIRKEFDLDKEFENLYKKINVDPFAWMGINKK